MSARSSALVRWFVAAAILGLVGISAQADCTAGQAQGWVINKPGLVNSDPKLRSELDLISAVVAYFGPGGHYYRVDGVAIDRGYWATGTYWESSNSLPAGAVAQPFTAMAAHCIDPDFGNGPGGSTGDSYSNVELFNASKAIFAAFLALFGAVFGLKMLYRLMIRGGDQ